MTATNGTFVAVDLGASTGRVMVGHVRGDQLRLEEAHRFVNAPVRITDTLHWDALAIYGGVVEGLRAALRQSRDIASIGIDGWAVDYGLLDADGALIGNPVHYRDARTRGVLEASHERFDPQTLYERTGIRSLPFNTLFQLLADPSSAQLSVARTLLLFPDLISFWLTGEMGAEVTNASTTQLFDISRQQWARDIIADTGVDAAIFPVLRSPRDAAGALLPAVSKLVGAERDIPVVAVCSHDTASAVVAVPASGGIFAYISCGTWSLVGVELDHPVLSSASREAGFTNEAGIDGTVRFLRNVMGLWLLQECMRAWHMTRSGAAIESLLREAAGTPAFDAVIDVDDGAFLAPDDMPGRIAAACAARGQRVPTSRAQVVRCILDSLALAYRSALSDAQDLAGVAVSAVHIVGGGSQNALLCQLTADACDLPVVAGPVEAASIGNVLVQAQAAGVLPPQLSVARALVASSYPVRTYLPSGQQSPLRRAAASLRGGSAT